LTPAITAMILTCIPDFPPDSVVN